MKKLLGVFAAFVLVLSFWSAGAQAARDYRLMARFPYTGNQAEACELVGLSPCSPKPIEEVCPRRYVENGSYLWAMTDTVRGVNKVGHDFVMDLDPNDSKTDHWAHVCNPFPNGWVMLKFEGCSNYVYTPANKLILRPEAAPVAQYRPPQSSPPPAPQAAVYSNTQPTYYPYPYGYGGGYSGGNVYGNGGTIRMQQGGAQAYAQGGNAYANSAAFAGAGSPNGAFHFPPGGAFHFGGGGYVGGFHGGHHFGGGHGGHR